MVMVVVEEEAAAAAAEEEEEAVQSEEGWVAQEGQDRGETKLEGSVLTGTCTREVKHAPPERDTAMERSLRRWEREESGRVKGGYTFKWRG